MGEREASKGFCQLYERLQCCSVVMLQIAHSIEKTCGFFSLRNDDFSRYSFNVFES